MNPMQTDNPFENDPDPKPIQTLMGESILAGIVKKAQILDKIDRHLSDMLSDNLSSCCHVLNLTKHCLILTINNSAAATRIRYQEETILNQLNRVLADLPNILRLECVVRP